MRGSARKREGGQARPGVAVVEGVLVLVSVGSAVVVAVGVSVGVPVAEEDAEGELVGVLGGVALTDAVMEELGVPVLDLEGEPVPVLVEVGVGEDVRVGVGVADAECVSCAVAQSARTAAAARSACGREEGLGGVGASQPENIRRTGRSGRAPRGHHSPAWLRRAGLRGGATSRRFVLRFGTAACPSAEQHPSAS